MNPGRQRILAALAATIACALAMIAGEADSAPHSIKGSAFVPGANSPQRGAGGPGEIVGTLYFSEDSNGNGLYSLDQESGSSAFIGASGVTSTTVGLAPGEDLTEIFGSRPSGLLRIAVDGKGVERTGAQLMEGMAYDRLGRRLYGTANQSFFRLNAETGTVIESLESPGVDLEGLAFGVDPSGRRGVYGLVGFGGTQTGLYFFDLQTWSVVGDTGIDWSHVGLAFDACNQVLYAKGSQDSMLYRLIPLGGGSVEVEEVGDTEISRGGGLAWVGDCPGPPCTDADVNRDGIVGFADILEIISSYGDCPPGPCTEPGSCRDGFIPGCGGDKACSCVELFDGTLACHRDFGCGDKCPDGTCPPGFHCVRYTCCGPAVCAPDETLCGDAGDPCDQDVTGDGIVGFDDILSVLSQWGPCRLPGACCLSSVDSGDVCRDGVTRDECEAMQGVYGGDGSNCEDTQCD